jgi:beta-1,4-mannosyl-glycoprotein beta-1,4-N-acetylglucosaminyltransferase
MKIYDCFTFYNELDLLEIRLNELNDVVDKFVLVEAERSHQNKPKPLYFEENKNRYKQFLDKIIHIVVKAEEFVDTHTWYNERLQRNKICDGLVDLNDDDLLIISDLDEIPTKQSIIVAKNNNVFPAVFEQLYHYYYLNTPMIVNNSYYNYGSVMLKKHDFLKNTELVRQPIKHTFHIIKNGGWHCTFLGNSDKVFDKIHNYAHNEFNFLDKNTVDNRLAELKDPFGRENYKLICVNNFDYLPEYVKINLDKFKNYIKN